MYTDISLTSMKAMRRVGETLDNVISKSKLNITSRIRDADHRTGSKPLEFSEEGEQVPCSLVLQIKLAYLDL